MATYKSDIISAKEALDVSGKSLSGKKTGGRVLYATAECVLGASGAANADVLELVDIPAGATVVPELSYVWKGFIDRNVKILLGDAGDDDRFGVVGTSTGGVTAGPGELVLAKPSQAFFGHEAAAAIPAYGEVTRVRAKLSGLTGTGAAGERLKFGIAYRVEG